MNVQYDLSRDLASVFFICVIYKNTATATTQRTLVTVEGQKDKTY